MSLWNSDPDAKSAFEDIDPDAFDPDAVTKALEDGGAKELERKIEERIKPYKKQHRKPAPCRRY